MIMPVYYSVNEVDYYINNYVKHCELLKIDPLKPLNLELYQQRIKDIRYVLANQSFVDKIKVLENLEKAEAFFIKRKKFYIELALLAAKYIREKRFQISENTIMENYEYIDTGDVHYKQLIKYDRLLAIGILVILGLFFLWISFL
jgi:hypothetical protein